MTFFEGGKTKQNLFGWKGKLSSFKGNAGFVLTGNEAAGIDIINEKLKQGTKPIIEEIADIMGSTVDAPMVKHIDHLVNTEKAAVVETKKFHKATLLGATGLKGLGTAIKTVGAEIKATMIQFAAFTAITWALGKAWEVVSKWFVENVHTLGNLKKRAELATEELESTRNEIKQINEELQTTRDRIEELNKKGPLSLTEQDEIKKLKLQNSLLEQQLRIQQQIETEQNKEASKKNIDVIARLNRDADANIKAYNTAKEKYEKAQDKFFNSNNQNRAQNQDKYEKAKANLRNAEQAANESLKEATKYIANVDIFALDAEGLTKFNEELAKTYKSMYDLGTINSQEYLEAILPTDEYDKMTAKMQELSATGKEVGADIINRFSKPVRDALATVGISAEDFAESINSLREFDNIINAISSETELQKLDEFLTSDLEITLSSIIQQMGQDWVDAMAEAGFANDRLVEKLKLLQHTVTKISIKNVTSELSTVEGNIKSISDAYAEFRDNNGKVSASTLDGLAETFAAIGDTTAFSNLINVLGDAKSSVSELQIAIDGLVDEYFNQEDVLVNVNEEQKALITNQLKQMGVANAAALVEYKLAIATIKSSDASKEAKEEAIKLAAKTYDTISALDTEALAALNAADKLELFTSYQDYAAGSNFADVIDGHAAALYRVAIAAGDSAQDLARYVEIIKQLATMEDVVVSAKKSGKLKDSNASLKRALLAELNAIATNAENQYNDLFKQNTSYKPSYEPKNSKDKKTKTDIYNEKKKELDNQLERNLIQYDEYYDKLVKLGKKYLKKDKEARAEHLANLADVRKNAYDKYQGDLDKQLEDGKISLQAYYNQSNKLAKHWFKNYKSNAEDLADAIITIGDNINDHWDNIISKTETRIERWNIDKTWAPDMDEAKVWEEKLQELQADYIAGLFDSTDDYYDKYYEILKKKNDALKNQLESQLDDLENRADNIQDLIDMVDEMLRKRIEEQIDLLEKQKSTYSDIVAKKKEALDLSRQELEYSRELEEKNKSLAELQAQAAVLALDDSRAGKAQYAKLLEEIKSKQTEISDFQADYTYEATTGALDNADERYQKSIQNKIDDLNAMTENQGKWLEYVYSYIKTTDPSALFKQLYDYNFQYGTGMNSTVDEIKKASLGLLTQYQSDIPKILAAIESQKVEINNAIGNVGQNNSDDLGANYDSNLLSKIQVTQTKKNSHAENMELLTQVRDLYGSGWYDEKNKIIYLGKDEDKSTTAAAYEIIKQMSDVNNQPLSKAEKKKQLDPLLEQLKKKYTYSQSYIKWVGDIAHLYKQNPSTKPIQVFHSGIKQGFVSDGRPFNVSSQQRELLALLQSGELVFNKNDQERLMVQMSTLKNLTDTLKKFDSSTAGGVANSNSQVIQLSITAPITVHGNVDDETLKKLEGLSDNIANKSLSLLQSAYEKRGYGSRVKSNSMRK